MLSQLLIGIEFLRPRQFLGFGNSGDEPLPIDHFGDGGKCILLLLAGGDHGSTHAGVEANLLVDRTCIGLKRARLPPLRAAKHRADEAVEHVDGMISQAGGKLDAGGDQCRVPALALVAGDMLHRHPASLAGELRQTLLVNVISAFPLDANRPHMFQALEQAEHGGRFAGLWHLSQPGQPSLAGVLAVLLPALRQRIEALRFYGGKTVAIAAPYRDDIVAREAAFLRAVGFRVVSSRGLGIGAEGPPDDVRPRTISPSLLYSHARKSAIEGTDVLFLADTDMPTLGIINALEADLGIPVISSNQAALWATLRAARVRVAIAGWGRLLATPT